jgi:hypothetical protein
MRSNGFDATARQLIVGLPLFMGEIVCAGRAAGEMRGEFWMSTQRIGQAIFIAYYRVSANVRLSDWRASMDTLARGFV